jgi:hypothetical protein
MTFTGAYLGLNAAFALASRRGLPADDAPLWARLARVLLGGALFWLIGMALQESAVLLPALAPSSPWGQLVHALLRVFLSISIGIGFCSRLRLYRPEAPRG